MVKINASRSKAAPPSRKKHAVKFVPKQSSRVNNKACAPADNDTWVEQIAIVDKQTKKYRSYFESQRTKRCYWDEPPSGATNILLLPSIE